MKRGELVTVVLQGDYGKPRPALVIQSDAYTEHTSDTVLPVMSTRADAPLLRVTIKPDAASGLTRVSQVMVDKATTVKRTRVGSAFGYLEPATMLAVERCLAVFSGITK